MGALHTGNGQNIFGSGLFFARELYRVLGVPIGIILSARPGTAAEEWTDPESLRHEPALQSILKSWDSAPAGAKTLAAGRIDFSLEFDDFELLPQPGDGDLPVRMSDFDDGDSRTSTGGDWTYSWKDSPGATFELVAPGRGGKGYAARVSGRLDENSASRLQANFHADLSAADMSRFSGIRFWVRGKGQFQLQILQPTISDWDNYAADIIQTTPEWKQVTIWFKDLKQAGWGVAKPLTLQSLTGFLLLNMTAAGEPDRPPSGSFSRNDRAIAGVPNPRGAVVSGRREHMARLPVPEIIVSTDCGLAEGLGGRRFPILDCAAAESRNESGTGRLDLGGTSRSSIINSRNCAENRTGSYYRCGRGKESSPAAKGRNRPPAGAVGPGHNVQWRIGLAFLCDTVAELLFLDVL